MSTVDATFPPVILEKDGFTLRGEFKYLPFDPERYDRSCFMGDDQAPTHTLELNFKIYKDGEPVALKTSPFEEPVSGDEYFFVNPLYNQYDYAECLSSRVDFVKMVQVDNVARILRQTANYYNSQENQNDN